MHLKMPKLFNSPKRRVRIAVIGSGLAATAISRQLADHAEVILFDKARGVGGRMATKRLSPYEFDHGAQYFIARTTAFQEFLQPLINAGIVDIWRPRFKRITREKKQHETVTWNEDLPHYVAIPGMNGMIKHLLKDAPVHLNTAISKITPSSKGWELIDTANKSHGPFEWVISTAPPEQSADFIPSTFSHRTALTSTKMKACYTLMLGIKKNIDFGFDAAHVAGYDISWISINQTKPGRGDSLSMIINSTNQWADEHIDEDPETVERHLLEQFSIATNITLPTIDQKKLQRWRYANAPKSDGPASYCDIQSKLGVCGDWCIQGRVEAAFRSGTHLANEILNHL